MKNIVLSIALQALLLALTCGNANAKDKTKPMSDSAKMQAWMDYMTPGDMHKMLASLDGNWVGDITMWMSPGTAPSKSTGYCTNKMIMDGRYLVSENTGSFGGMNFEGRNTMGYDKAKKVFFCSWIDNMGTGIMNIEGPYNAATKTISMKGKEVDPATGKEFDVREDIRIIDQNNETMVMYSNMGGKEYKNMEIVYKRK